MNIETLEQEVTKLSTIQLNQFRTWFLDYDADKWDKQIEKDAKAGKLDAFANDALKEYQDGQAQEI